MAKPGFKSITVAECVYDKFYSVYDSQKDELKIKGVNSFSAYIVYSLEQALKEIKTKFRFNLVNCCQIEKRGTLIIYDTWEKQAITIENNDGVQYCKLCESKRCIHVGFVWSLYQSYQMKVKTGK